MAKLIATNYDDLLRILTESGGTKKIGHNTVAELDEWDIIITLHGHEILRLQDGGRTMFNLAGWGTVTTRERINQFIKGRIYQKDNTQYYENEPIDAYGWYYDYVA